MAPFAYWDGEDRAQIAAFYAEWTSAFPSFRIYDDDVDAVFIDRILALKSPPALNAFSINFSSMQSTAS